MQRVRYEVARSSRPHSIQVIRMHNHNWLVAERIKTGHYIFLLERCSECQTERYKKIIKIRNTEMTLEVSKTVWELQKEKYGSETQV